MRHLCFSSSKPQRTSQKRKWKDRQAKGGDTCEMLSSGQNNAYYNHKLISALVIYPRLMEEQINLDEADDL